MCGFLVALNWIIASYGSFDQAPEGIKNLFLSIATASPVVLYLYPSQVRQDVATKLFDVNFAEDVELMSNLQACLPLFFEALVFLLLKAFPEEYKKWYPP